MCRGGAPCAEHGPCQALDLPARPPPPPPPHRVYRGWLQPEAATATAVGPAAGGSSAEALGRAILGESGAPRPLPVAVKVMEAADLGAFLREADLMTRLAGSPHVVALHGACVADQQLIVVMELMEVRGKSCLFCFFGKWFCLSSVWFADRGDGAHGGRVRGTNPIESVIYWLARAGNALGGSRQPLRDISPPPRFCMPLRPTCRRPCRPPCAAHAGRRPARSAVGRCAAQLGLRLPPAGA